MGECGQDASVGVVSDAGAEGGEEEWLLAQEPSCAAVCHGGEACMSATRSGDPASTMSSPFPDWRGTPQDLMGCCLPPSLGTLCSQAPDFSEQAFAPCLQALTSPLS